MTTLQELMLALSFGVSLGTSIGQAVFIIKNLNEYRKLRELEKNIEN